MRVFSKKVGLGALFASALVVAGACGEESDDEGEERVTEGTPELVPFDCPEVPAAAGEHVVMVVDQGFDPSLPIFQGKLAGCFRRVCDDEVVEAPPADAPEAKRRLIEQLGRPDPCRIEPGVVLRKSGSFDGIARYKAAWNDAIGRKTLDQGFPHIRQIARVLGGEDSYSYHGTWVASLIAYRNPNVKLVLVADDSIRRADAEPRCPTPAEFEADLALYRDPEVRAAYVASPYGPSSRQVDDVVRRLGVTLVNESFGVRPWRSMNEACPGLDWQGYYAARAELDNLRFEQITQSGALDGMSVLTVAAAGNEGQALDVEADSQRCGGSGPDGFGPDSTTLLVGSYDPLTAERSTFSNEGACVDAYAPGQDIVVSGPGGWLYVVSGTSFAAPMAVRFLSLGQPSTSGGPGLSAALLASRLPDQNLPTTAFPSPLFFKNRAVGISPDFLSARGALRPGRPPAFLPPRSLDPHRPLGRGFR